MDVLKVGEVKGELDLRLHLHEPRARRIELDVHNVRASKSASTRIYEISPAWLIMLPPLG